MPSKPDTADLSDPRAVADALATLAGAGHLGAKTSKIMDAGAKTIRRLLGDRPASVIPDPPPAGPPKRAV